MLEQISIKVGTGRYTIWLTGTVTADGLILELLGGEKPHVGAIVLTVLRPDSINTEKIKCNSTVVPRLGHKEDELAKPIAEEIAKTLQQAVVLVAGIHIDNATPEEIKILVDNSWLAARQLINEIKNKSE